MRFHIPFAVALATFLCILPADSEAKKKKVEEEKDSAHLTSETLSALEFRSIGPALTSGRITDFAVTPGKRQRYFVAVASGGVWRTDNAGTTWSPVFDGEGSYSIGCLAMDPADPDVIWVGTGENNSQRSVSFGDGVYKSLDGGQSWTNMGLEASEHIGRIVIDPRDSDVVWVAAQGPLWAAGGDRGLYKTIDGGKSWDRVLHISEDTGINEVWLDPRDPDVVYASSYQRRRHVWTLLNGGPESGLHKSTDGGKTWKEINSGLPSVDMGRIGLTVSPVDPDVLYAIVEAQRDEGGLYRSTNQGESWERRSDYMATSPQYYNELVASPHDVDTLYSLDTWMVVSRDGGETWDRVGNEHRHVDDHALWLDPEDPDYLLVGGDGGVYESLDRGAHWRFMENMPITQYYRVSVDTSKPFYYVYGGTQDNNSMGGPSRTIASSGITNEDWFITVGGDGYETVIDPTDPNTVYAQWQYGGLVRYDRRSGELIDIQPQEEPGEEAHRWNWDSPIIISPHSPTRLYYAAQRLFKSDDRGNSWTAISEDLSRQLDRDQLRLMGRLWPMDAVSKNRSTSDYGNIVSLDESPLVAGLLYVGTDDGLIQVSEDDGTTWRKIETFPGVPEMAYVSDLEASLHDADTVYATFVNYKMGDFAPYVAVSRDRGRTWSSIRGDLPDRQITHCLVQDHEKPELLFAGTEFGVYVTLDEGTHWHELTGGLPTIQVRDIEIQREWNDLVLGTFGRGFYVLDDYTPLRHLTEAGLTDNEALLIGVRDAPLYVEMRDRIGSRGHSFWTAENPPYGAVATYWLRDGLKTLQEARIEAEDEAIEAEKDPPIATMAELRAEDLQLEPAVHLVVRDAADDVIRRVDAPRTQGLHRVAWDLRRPPATPTDLSPGEYAPHGPLVGGGTYSMTLEATSDGTATVLAGPAAFAVEPLDLATFGAEDPGEVEAFRRELRDLRRAARGAARATDELEERVELLRQALRDTAGVETLSADLEKVQTGIDALQLSLEGDATRDARNDFRPPSILERVERNSDWDSTQPPTGTVRQNHAWAAEAFEDSLADLKTLAAELSRIEREAEAAGAPWTPGRIPEWSPEG